MDKPLPQVPELKIPLGSKHIPPSATLATLSVDAQAHLRKFILNAVSEEKDTLPETDWEDWTSAVEGALGELGERISLGGWLVGLRRARVRAAQNRERTKTKRTVSSDTVMPRKDDANSTLKSKPHDEQSYFSVGRLTGRSVVTVSSQTPADAEPEPPPPSKESLQALRDLASRPSAPAPKPTAKHLLLTVSPLHSALPGSPDDARYDFPRSHVQCTFKPGVFLVPEDMTSGADTHGVILYGLDTWDASLLEGDVPLQLVGGTFSFGGINTDVQYQALTKILRLSMFVYLSCILEQSLLADSHVPLRFPKPSMSPTSAMNDAGASVMRALSTGHVSRTKQEQPSSLWAFFSRKKDDLLHRAIPVRRPSLELPLARKLSSRGRSPASPRASHELSSPPARPRRFSFIADYKPAFLQQREDREPETIERPFTAALNRIEKARPFLSTSPNVTFTPPALLVKLAAREKSDPKLRLGGDEKAALSYLLGWEGKESQGAGMADTRGFVRQQLFSVLYSEYIPHTSLPSSRPTTPGASQSSASTLSLASTITRLVPCGRRRRWVTFRFYSRDSDETLGEAVTRMCSRAEDPCHHPGCHYTQGEHELRYVHDRIRIHVDCTRSGLPSPPTEEEELPEMWESCSICARESPRVRMQDATYLLSYAKFLELLVYSSSLCTLTPSLCVHTSPPPRPWPAEDSPLPRSRLNIVRHFSFQDRIVSFTLTTVQDVFEVRVPRLQILRHKVLDHSKDSEESGIGQRAIEEERRKLRREIMCFWQNLAEHMDTLEESFSSSEHIPAISYHKSLPRLPSVDDAYSFEEDGLATPKGGPSKLPPLPPNTPRTPGSTSSKQSYPFPTKDDAPPPRPSVPSTPDSQPSTSSQQDSLTSLTNLRHTFQRTEQDLYAELSRTPVSTLNDARRSFLSAARGATKRLSAWEAKHAPGQATVPDAMAQSEPEWWQSGCHAVPGGNVIVREDDWGSIIAFTLSSNDYQKELANMGSPRSVLVLSASPSTPSTTRPSFFEKTRWFGSTSSLPDPDADDVVWHEPEACSAVISRKEHPRDAPSLLKLGIPEVLRQKAFSETSSGSGTGTPSGSNLTVGAPPSAWAKAEVQVSKEAADGLVTTGTVSRADRVLHELEAATTDGNGTLSSAHIETAIRRGKASSIMSNSSNSTTNQGDAQRPLPPPPPPPKDPPRSQSETGTASSSSLVPGAGTLTQTLSSALRYMLHQGRPLPPPPPPHHGLLHSTASPTIDERPHIKYDWTIGKRLRFSCTVYYAKQFDALRRRCGVEAGFLTSLARSKNWAADGGKSRSNFWKTEDGRFIIKTLVNAWNVADLHVLLELGPAYFRYMDATTSRPTVLAKLLGFYTVEIKNLETGTTQAKADLLVMENLFFGQDIMKTYDLKGIQGRKVKTKTAAPGGTLFDGDWIEGQQRALTLVQPYSKVVLQEAVKADCEFLAKSNIMDYSLLVGIDESRKQIACGLVDTIGSYTFAKTLEYKAKQGLNSGKEVTVIPPHEYQERFVNAMDQYFIACPDRWSRPLDDTKIPSDWRSLPSVL